MILYGAGGHAKVVASAVEKVTSYVDDDIRLTEFNGKTVQTYSSELFPDHKLVVTIGNNRIREEVVRKVQHAFGTVKHSSAVCDPSVSIGEGSQVLHGAIIQAGTVLGKHVIVNTGASIDHDCRIGDFCHIAPQVTLCGNVTVGKASLIGAGATILPGISIGANCVIGAGSVVNKDLPSGCTAVGNPVRIIKKNEG